MTAAVIVSIRVGATPLRAFEAFTEKIGDWWRPNHGVALTPRGDGHLRFEPVVWAPSTAPLQAKP
jgi:hypothetical protein